MEMRLFILKPRHLLSGALVFLGLFISSRFGYLLFHGVAEAFAVSVSVTVFMVSWSTRRSPDAGYFSFLGIGCLFAGILSLFHLLSYKGMGVFPGFDANLPTQLWIAARFLLAVSLLAAPAFCGRSLNNPPVLLSFTAVSAFLLASIFAWKIFPDCFVEGKGLTSFKIFSEYAICMMFLASIVFLLKKREHFDGEVLGLLIAAIAAAVAAELSFTLYTDVYGIANLLGHAIEILSYFLIYRAVVGTDLVRKQELGIRLQHELDERKIAEKHIRHLASFPQMNPSPVIEIDSAGKIVYSNPATGRMLETLGMGKDQVEIFLPPDLGEILNSWDGNSVSVHYREVDVKEITCSVNLSLLPDFKVGRIYVQDITERKRAAKALQEAHDELETRVRDRTAELYVVADRLKAELDYRRKTEDALRNSMVLLENIFSNIHLCVVYLDPEFNFIRVNKAYADSCGYPTEFFPGKNHFDVYPHPGNESIFRTVVKSKKPYHAIAKPFEFPDHPEWGVTYWDWSLLPIAEPGGDVSGLILCLVDVTERKRAEDELALSEERFRSLVTGSLVGIFTVRDGRIVYMNPEQQRLFGDIPENLALKDFPDVHPEDRSRFEDFCDTIGGGRGEQSMDLRFYPFGKSAEETDMRWVHCRATPIGSNEERSFLVNMIDNTRLKEMERQVMIREKLASLGHVSAGIAHEVRGPLSGINLYIAALRVLLMNAESLDDYARGEAEAILHQFQSASQRIESVIKKVMDLIRPTPPQKTFADIGSAIENAVDFTSAHIRKSGITLRQSVNGLPKCPADPSLITQVMINLITNAAQALENGNGTKVIEIATALEDGKIVLTVSDSGPGVPQALRTRIFDPFYTTRKDGYGIGLSFCRRVIESHGGTLTVLAGALGGAEFRIEIPMGERGPAE